MQNKDMRLKHIKGYGIAIGLAIILSACGSTQPPMQTIAETRVAVRQAEQIGARDYAPLEIRQARKKLEQAQTLVEEKKYEEAKRLAEEAKVDAELAGAKALSGKAQRAVRELREGIKVLKEEIERNQQDQ